MAYSERGTAEGIAAAFPSATRCNDMYDPMYHGERFWVLTSAGKEKGRDRRAAWNLLILRFY